MKKVNHNWELEKQNFNEKERESKKNFKIIVTTTIITIVLLNILTVILAYLNY